jgi:hypothetical protein
VTLAVPRTPRPSTATAPRWIRAPGRVQRGPRQLCQRLACPPADHGSPRWTFRARPRPHGETGLGPPLTGPRRAPDATRQKPQSGRPGRHLDYRGPLPRCERGKYPRSCRADPRRREGVRAAITAATAVPLAPGSPHTRNPGARRPGAQPARCRIEPHITGSMLQRGGTARGLAQGDRRAPGPPHSFTRLIGAKSRCAAYPQPFRCNMCCNSGVSLRCNRCCNPGVSSRYAEQYITERVGLLTVILLGFYAPSTSAGDQPSPAGRERSNRKVKVAWAVSITGLSFSWASIR